jgi:gamma-glutamylcyclotransferase (GGCT)/AIG2-like uncharacterized protein YtfP
MSAQIIQLFVYGSLRQGFNNPFFDFIRNHFDYVGPATVKGTLYDLGDYPAGIPSQENTIVGELYAAKSEADFNWAIAQLDDYEGLHLEEGEHAKYRREIATITHNGLESQSWMYWYTGDVSGERIIPSGDVMDYVRSRSSDPHS